MFRESRNEFLDIPFFTFPLIPLLSSLHIPLDVQKIFPRNRFFKKISEGHWQNSHLQRYFKFGGKAVLSEIQRQIGYNNGGMLC